MDKSFSLSSSGSPNEDDCNFMPFKLQLKFITLAAAKRMPHHIVDARNPIIQP
jgi:hypothetical protein